MLSATKTYADIDPELKKEVLSRLAGGEMPRRDDGSYQFVHLIEKHGTWHYRAVFQRIDYGTFCEEKLAAFVANVARLYPNKSREEIWGELGIANLDDLPEGCLVSQSSQSESPASSQVESYSLRPRNPTRSIADE